MFIVSVTVAVSQLIFEKNTYTHTHTYTQPKDDIISEKEDSWPFLRCLPLQPEKHRKITNFDKSIC